MLDIACFTIEKPNWGHLLTHDKQSEINKSKCFVCNKLRYFSDNNFYIVTYSGKTDTYPWVITCSLECANLYILSQV